MLSAESGEQALEMLAATPPDLMLLDVRLPGIDGVQTLQRALALHAGPRGADDVRRTRPWTSRSTR